MQPVPLPSIKVNAHNFFGPVGYFDFSTDSKPKGLALVINNYHFVHPDKDRIGSEKDVAALITLFLELRYDFQVHQDKTADEMKGIVEAFMDTLISGKYQACIIVIMTHGYAENGREYLSGYGNTNVSCKDLLSPLYRSNNKNVQDTPKLIFIQACRTNRDRSRPFLLPPGRNMHIFNSTLPGLVSYRSIENGSFFVQAVCKIIGQYAHEAWADLNNLVLEVTKRVIAGAPQVPAPQAQLSKRFHFFPVEVIHNGSSVFAEVQDDE